MPTLLDSPLSVNAWVQVSYRWGCTFRRRMLQRRWFWATPACRGWVASFSGVAGLTYAVWRPSIGDGQSLVFEPNATGSAPVSPGAVDSRERSTGLIPARHDGFRFPASRTRWLMRARTHPHWVKPDLRKGRHGALCQCQPAQLRSPLPERGGVGISFSILSENRRQGTPYPSNGSFSRIGRAKEFASQIVCCWTDCVGTPVSLPGVPASPGNTPSAGPRCEVCVRRSLGGETRLEVRAGCRTSRTGSGPPRARASAS